MANLRDDEIEFHRSAAAELDSGAAKGVNPERWDRIREQDFLVIAEEIAGQRCLKQSFIHCPFHTDKTASFKLYDNDAYCFGCGQFYDAIALVSKYRDISRFKALLWLEKFFNLPPMDNVEVETEDDEREISFEQTKHEYIRFASKDIQQHPNLGLAEEYLQYYFQSKAAGTATQLLMVLGPEFIAKIAEENGLE